MENNLNFWLNESHMNALAHTTILSLYLFLASWSAERVQFMTFDKLARIV
jgi:hypothetical protein